MRVGPSHAEAKDVLWRLARARQPNTTGKPMKPTPGSATQRRKANMAKHRGAKP